MTADAAAFDPRLTSGAAFSSQPNAGPRIRGSVFDLSHVVHATGKFLDLYEQRRRAQAQSRQPQARQSQAGQANTRQSSTPTRPAAPVAANSRAAQPVRPASATSTPRLPKQPANPFHQNLRAGMKAGLIPPTLGRLLVQMTGNDTNPAVRADAASQAAFALTELEGRAFQANTYLRLEEAQTKQLANSEAKWRAANAEVITLLASVYRDPAAALTNLKAHIAKRPGYGTVAQEIRNEPELLGSLRGNVVFKRAERREALAAVSRFVAAIEQSGSLKSKYANDRDALVDHKNAPRRDPNLADALKAHSSLMALQAAIPAEDAAAYPDGLTTSVLFDFAQTVSERVSPADLADPAVRTLDPVFRARLTDQMQRIGDLQSLLANNAPDRAVQTFVAAARVMDANIDAANHLQRDGHTYPAQRAAEWSNVAHQIMRDAARTIISNGAQLEAAQQAGILPQVVEFHQSLTAQSNAPTMRPADMAFDGPDMA